MKLSIIIVAFNARDDLAGCLASLQAAPPAIPYDVTVVDNASTDGGIAEVSARWPQVRTIELGRNLGFAAGNNVGIRATEGDLLLLLNSDTIARPGALDVLAARLLSDPAIGAVGPRLVDANGRVELSFGSMITPFAEMRQKAVGALYGAGIGPIVSWVNRITSLEQDVDWVSGACLMVRRRDAEAVGLLDERFFLYTEDVDFCAQLRARGRRIVFAPAAEVTHVRGRSRASAPAAMNVAYRRSQLAFYEKHHPGWLPVLRAYLRLKGALPPD